MKPPVEAPTSRQRRPFTSRPNASSAPASFTPPRETYGWSGARTSTARPRSTRVPALSTRAPRRSTSPASTSAWARARDGARPRVTSSWSRRTLPSTATTLGVERVGDDGEPLGDARDQAATRARRVRGTTWPSLHRAHAAPARALRGDVRRAPPSSPASRMTSGSSSTRRSKPSGPPAPVGHRVRAARARGSCRRRSSPGPPTTTGASPTTKSTRGRGLPATAALIARLALRASVDHHVLGARRRARSGHPA